MDHEILPPDFNLYRCDRNINNSTAERGGGVLIATRQNIVSSSIELPGFLDTEVLSVKLAWDDINIFVIGLYIVPKFPVVLYKRYIDAIAAVTNLMLPTDRLIVFGDFNLPRLKWTYLDEHDTCLSPVNTHQDREVAVIDGLSTFNTSQINYVTNARNRILDLIFANDHHNVALERCISPLIREDTDHPALDLFLSLDIVISSSTEPISSSYNFKAVDLNHLSNHISTIDWSVLYSISDVDVAVLEFYNLLSPIFSEIPLMPWKPSNKKPPWFDKHMANLKKLKNRAYKTWRYSKLVSDYEKYSLCRKQLTDYSRRAQTLYLLDTQNNIKSNPQNFWNYVNLKKRCDSYPTQFHYNNVPLTSSIDISNAFADFFQSNYVNSSEPIDKSYFNYLDNLSNLNVPPFIIDESSVLMKLNSLDTNYSSGPDLFPDVLLKCCASSLYKILTYIFNLSIKTQRFPISWKSSYIIPLHKSGRKDVVENYRPIAKLSTIPKLFESIITDFLYFYCKPAISNLQHGFVKGRSTSTNLVEFSEYVTGSLLKGFQVDAIYTDFSKAFDRINHDVLLFKLSKLGISDNIIRWIHSYLTERTQVVKFRMASSEPVYVTSGVPQGSHLGPLLFLLFVNDVPAILIHALILMFADDFKIYLSINNLIDCIHLQEDLSRFSVWCLKNKLFLNFDKCKRITLTRKFIPIDFAYQLNENVVNKVEFITDLGVIVDKKLTFNLHIESIVNRANKLLGFIKRFSADFSDPYVVKILFISFVRSILEYACVVWCPYYDIYIKRLESVQKKFLRFALRGLPWADTLNLPAYEDRLKLLSLQTLELRRHTAQTRFIHRLLNGDINAPNLLSKLNINSRPCTLRTNDFLYQSMARTNYGLNAPLRAMTKSYNADCHLLDF